MTSFALWIPIIWFILIGTQLLAFWFTDASSDVATLDNYLEGNPFNRNVFSGILILGLAILIKRRKMLSGFFSENRLFFVFFIFCAISVFWSNYPLTSFKRYIKDIGNIIMALIIITEIKPAQALKAVLARYTYLAIILSVLFIKYIPEYGRYYNRWTYEVGYGGVTTNKNDLGVVALICGIFLLWDLITVYIKKYEVMDKFDLLLRIILLFLVIWLMHMAHSSTATISMLIGSLTLVFLFSSFGKRQIHNLGKWFLAILFFMIILFTIPVVLDIFSGVFGRDATLTGRTDIWHLILTQSSNNPLLGAGYNIFWESPAGIKVGENYYFRLNQAHNGYLEVYIQTGLISLLLLIGAIIVGFYKLKKGLLAGNNIAILLFSFFVIALIGNLTEAIFNKMNIRWFVLITALLFFSNKSSTNSDIGTDTLIK
ncbi:MAG: O-antigen ligase family protein [Smithella sp.]|jgi:O-antigen ligase